MKFSHCDDPLVYLDFKDDVRKMRETSNIKENLSLVLDMDRSEDTPEENKKEKQLLSTLQKTEQEKQEEENEQEKQEKENDVEMISPTMRKINEELQRERIRKVDEDLFKLVSKD